MCGETGQRAGREAYRGPHPQVTIMLKQTYVSFYRPRSQVFNEVAEVLEMVDSKGAGEIVRLRYCENVNLKRFEMRL